MGDILLVDDDAGTRETFSLALCNAGYAVNACDSGEQALEDLRRDTFQVAIVDLRLGAISGIDIVRFAREHQPLLSIVVITAFGTVSSAVEAMKLGVVDYLEKPIDSDDLVCAVRALITRNAVGHRSQCRADAFERWAYSVAVVTFAPEDPRTLRGWADLNCAAVATLRSWCRTAGLSPKRSLDFARMLRATYQAQVRHAPASTFINCADRRTRERLLSGGGFIRSSGAATSLQTFLGLQSFIRSELALEQLRTVLVDRGVFKE